MAQRQYMAALTKAMSKYWGNNPVENIEAGPLAINNEALKAVNAAGTGLVDLIKADTNNLVQVGDSPAIVTVTPAQILALNATPITLVPAPGAGIVLDFLGAIAVYDYNSAAYAVDANEDLVIRYTNGSGAIASTTLEATGFLSATSDQIRTFKPIVTDLAPVANSPLVLHMLNGEVIAGNSPLRLTVFFRKVATGL